ncbi:coiled-coil domain-containing protein 148 [Pelodytes ibericus]
MFLTTHRANDDLVVRMKNGVGNSKYKPVDYQQLRSETEAKKLASAGIQLKIKKAQHVSRIRKDRMLEKQHSQVWWKEYERLTESRTKIEQQLSELLDEGSVTYDIFSDLYDIAERQLCVEREEYKESSVLPIWQLRDDLKHRIREIHYHSSHQMEMGNDFHPENIIQQIEFVKKQQCALTEILAGEQRRLHQDLNDCEAQELIGAEEIPLSDRRVPAGLLELQCPYPDLKASVLSEYEGLANGFLSRLQELNRQLKDIDRECRWSDENHWIFRSIISQYPHDLPNQRALYLDMLSRHLPGKSRQELVRHENIWNMHRFAKDQRKALMENWARYRKDFVIKAIMTIAEACSAHETERILANDRRKQQEICMELKEKVRQLRAHQEEAARLASSIAARRIEHEEEEHRREQEKGKLHRADEKNKIQKYKAEKQQVWEELQRRDQQRLDQLTALMAHQAERDRERVEYRQQVLEQRLLERKEVARLAEQEEEDRQRRLDALRQQVAVMAEFDPVRMMSDTIAFKAKMGIGAEDEVYQQKPLFQLHTYNEQQITADRRVRVDMALREAGLHKTLYAKEMLPKIPPPKPPRKDMKSTVFAK